MSILIGLIPALAWGLLPIAVSRAGGKPSNQILGTTAGTFIAALAVFLYLRPETSGKVFLVSALSGAAWVAGQVGQYHAYAKIGVSRTMPISTGLQLVGTSLIGVLAFGEWGSSSAKPIGFAALAIVVLGVCLTSIQKRDRDGTNDMPTIALLFVTNFGYLAYSAIPDIVGERGTAIFFPQAAGMLGAAAAYTLFGGHACALRERSSWKNVPSGFLFAVAALAYIVSAQRNGIATGFVLSQLSVVLSTILGIAFLKERKTPFELKATAVGLLLILGGAATIAFLK
ncbi:MAG: GRP family sugar transporter [Deltaproteobacteria bacterium]|nr:GRP family sugar transporter [Deltaproteobacteria bacterium]